MQSHTIHCHLIISAQNINSSTNKMQSHQNVSYTFQIQHLELQMRTSISIL